MVEFITTSSIYTPSKNSLQSIQGHIFTQKDVEVRVGVLTVNYPKLLLVQILYRPSVYTDLNKGEKSVYFW